MLTVEEVYHFDLKGYLVVKRAIEPDLIRALHDQLCELERVGKEHLPPQCIPHWTPVVNEYRIMNIIECGNLFIQLIDHSQILGRIEALVPGPIRLTEAYSISRKRGIGLPLHATPIAQYRMTPSGPKSFHVKAIINLTDCGPEDGPLVVFEGTHKLGMPFPYSIIHPDWPTPTHDVAMAQAYLKADGSAPTVKVPWEQIPGYKEVYAEAGDLLVFTEDLWHGAKELRSDRTRRSLYFAYSPYHFATWHGVEYSAELKQRATDRQRHLLSGPFIGSFYEGADIASRVPADVPFQILPNSERRSTWGEDNPPVPLTPAPREDLLAETLREIFEQTLPQRLAANPELAMAHLGICQLIISGKSGGKWFLDLTDRNGQVIPGECNTPDCVVEVNSQDFVDLFTGKAEPAELFYQGKLAVRGNISVAMQMATLWGE